MHITPQPSQSQVDPQALLNSQSVIITVIDPVSYKVQFQNDAGLTKFGDISAQPCYEKLWDCPAPCTHCRMPEAVQSGKITWSEVPVSNNQWLLVQWSKSETSDGLVHIVESITDVTDRKRMEQDIRQAQKMEAIGRVAGGIAHDFNNLLTVIKGHCEELLHKLPPDSMDRLHLEGIGHAGERAAMLTRKLLAFSRRQPLSPRKLQLNAVLADMEPMLRRLIGEHIEIVTRRDPTLGHIQTDPVQLEQVILNLVVNARDAMTQAGTITIETANVDWNEAYTRQHRGAVPGAYVQLCVRDTGCGMDADTLGQVFEPFFTTKEPGKGTGLGLATVYGFLKQTGGYIEVTSEPGRGSIFRVYLPRLARDPAGTVTSPSASSAHSPGGHETILLVEDDLHVRRIAGMVLRRHGYQVLEEADGTEALKLVQQGNVCPQLVITDVIMPRMNGPELLRELKALTPSIKTLYISGYTGQSIPEGLTDSGTDYLQKPFGPYDLAQKVRAILDS